MIVTKQIETEIKLLLENYWASYITGDLESFASYLSDDYKNIGTTQQEIWNNKQEIMDYTKAIIDQMIGNAEFRNKQTEVFSIDQLILTHEFGDVYIKMENEWVFYAKVRLSTIIKKEDGNWKLIHQHGSYPDTKTEPGETFAFDKISTENRELKDAIKRKTIELENKNRELEIETSLERVRTIAMSMNKRDNMLDICRIISQQLELLNVKEIRNVQTAIIYESKGTYLNYEYYRLHDKTFITDVDYNLHKAQADFANQMLEGPEAFHKKSFIGKEVYDWAEYQKTTPQFVDSFLYQATSLNYYWYSMGQVALGISTYSPLNENEILLFKRFRNVFELAYRRLMDIEEAEAQTREAQIELALERVRARTMAMQKSDELSETAYILYQQFKELGQDPEQLTIGIINEPEHTIELWLTMQGSQMKQMIAVSIDEPFVINKIYNAWKEQKKSLTIDLSGNDLKDYNDYRNSLKSDMNVNNDRTDKRRVITIAFFSKGELSIASPEPLSVEGTKLLERFAGVFNLTYTRFLDLQNAEAQTRDAQIELALERVRARTMAMQHSNELQDAAILLFEQMKTLGVHTGSCGFNIWDKKEKTAIVWMSSPEGGLQTPFTLPHTKSAIYKQVYEAMEKGEDFLIKEVGGKSLKNHFDYLLTLQGIGDLIKKLRETGYAFPETMVYHFAFFNQGYLSFHLHEHHPEAHDIFKRFAKVFEQTYTRFLDLQKAELQARDARIEAALERVRSKTMGMQKSEELKEIIRVVYEQFIHLNILVEHAGFILDYKERDDMHIWLADRNEIPSEVTIPYFDSPHWNSFNEAKKEGQDFFANHLSFEEKNKFYEELFMLFPGVSSEAKDYYFKSPGLAISTALLDNVGLYIENFSAIPYTDQENNTLMRFGKVFQQTYTRFLDLQKAEAQAREAKIEASLERMRAVAMSIRKSEELIQVAESLYTELRSLGFDNIRNAQVVIQIEGDHLYLICVYSEISAEIFKEYRYDTAPIIQKLYDELDTSKEALYQKEFTGNEFEEWLNWRRSTSTNIDQRLLNAGSVSFCLYSFGGGHLGISSYNSISNDQLEVLKRFRNVFELSYRRFMDIAKSEEQALKLKLEKERLEQILSELQVTQKQLIQSEKMASLGELTAGIAHEIQNPLNFVNNFSEINTELIEEMKIELKAGNHEDAIVIANDIFENEQKINHHGKRADAIVKGMLQHSRKSSGIKEPTDINALADEYLRLAYHGLRAKDKSFNATLKTEFDESIGNINIIPQDIGRVILNLITNAFYAVTEKKKQIGSTFEPIVIVTTKKNNSKIEIRVIDNGNGIPQKVLDKIFQPFFTTKPTGQGTGLGLSLSYDIIKAHGGEIKIETSEGEGSEFMILLSE